MRLPSLLPSFLKEARSAFCSIKPSSVQTKDSHAESAVALFVPATTPVLCGATELQRVSEWQDLLPSAPQPLRRCCSSWSQQPQWPVRQCLLTFLEYTLITRREYLWLRWAVSQLQQATLLATSESYRSWLLPTGRLSAPATTTTRWSRAR